MLRNLSRRVLAFGIVAVLELPGIAAAAGPASTGLGQAWPNATDVSLSPHYHVYVFTRDGIRYIQINDANGVVRGAIAAADGVMLVLPIGTDASHVRTLHVASGETTPTTSTGTSTETVYRDQTTTLSVTPQSSGTLLITTQQASTCTSAGECSAGGS